MRHAPAQNPPLAAFMLLTSTVFIAGSILMAKLLGTDALGPPLHSLQISQGRFCAAFVVIALASAATRQKIERPNLRVHFGRSLMGWGGISLMFAAVAYIPMADATAISFLNPVFAMLLAIPVLGERVGPWRWAAAGIALIGALILLRPTPASFQPAALLALAAALATGLEIIFIKRLADREAPLQILLINNFMGVVISSLAAIAFLQMPTPAQWAALVGVGWLMACAQICFVNAMARADASFVAPFSYATLVFAALYDGVVFAVIPDWITVLGAMIILSGGALLAWRESVNRRKHSDTDLDQALSR